jgi:hypothetical protein
MKPAIIVMLGLLISAVAFGAQESGKDKFWGSLQGKAQKLSARKKTTAPAVVAGIKGAKHEKADIYWKGKEGRVEVDEDELQKFNQAVESQSRGEKALALQHFETFLKEYPTSSLREDCLEAVRLLSSELNLPPVSAPAAKIPPAPATPAESGPQAPMPTAVSPQTAPAPSNSPK